MHTDGLLVLPGGGIEAGELPIAATASEQREETSLQARALLFAFNHPSTHNFHHVFVATQVLGEARPQDDAAALNLLALADIRLALSRFDLGCHAARLAGMCIVNDSMTILPQIFWRQTRHTPHQS